MLYLESIHKALFRFHWLSYTSQRNSRRTTFYLKAESRNRLQDAEAERSELVDSQIRQIEFDFLQAEIPRKESEQQRDEVFRSAQIERYDAFVAYEEHRFDLFEQAKTRRIEIFRINEDRRNTIVGVGLTAKEKTFLSSLDEYSAQYVWYSRTADSEVLFCTGHQLRECSGRIMTTPSCGSVHRAGACRLRSLGSFSVRSLRYSPELSSRNLFSQYSTYLPGCCDTMTFSHCIATVEQRNSLSVKKPCIPRSVTVPDQPVGIRKHITNVVTVFASISRGYRRNGF